MASSTAFVSARKASVLVYIASFGMLLLPQASVAVAPHQDHGAMMADAAFDPSSSFTTEFYGDEEEEDATVMIQVGVTTTAPKKRVTGILPAMDEECGWGEPCEEEEEDGAMLFQERVVKRGPNNRKMLEDSEFDDSSI